MTPPHRVPLKYVACRRNAHSPAPSKGLNQGTKDPDPNHVMVESSIHRTRNKNI